MRRSSDQDQAGAILCDRGGESCSDIVLGVAVGELGLRVEEVGPGGIRYKVEQRQCRDDRPSPKRAPAGRHGAAHTLNVMASWDIENRSSVSC